MGIIPGFLSMFGWGTSDLFAALLSRKSGFFATLFWSQLAGFLFALSYFLVNFSSFEIEKFPKYIFVMAPFAFLHMIAFLAYYKGFAENQVSLVSPLATSYVAIIVILSIFIFKETLKISQFAAIVLIVMGIFLVSVNLGSLRNGKRLSAFGGVKEGLTAMLLWGFSMFSIIYAARAIGWFLPIFFFRMLVVIFLFFFAILTRKSLAVTAKPSAIAMFLAIGFLDVSAFLFYGFGVTKGYVSIIAPIAASYPLVTIILMRIFVKEKLALNQIVGIAGIICGLILISI